MRGCSSSAFFNPIAIFPENRARIYATFARPLDLHTFRALTLPFAWADQHRDDSDQSCVRVTAISRDDWRVRIGASWTHRRRRFRPLGLWALIPFLLLRPTTTSSSSSRTTPCDRCPVYGHLSPLPLLLRPATPTTTTPSSKTMLCDRCPVYGHLSLPCLSGLDDDRTTTTTTYYYYY